MKKTKFMTRLGAVVFALAILFAMAVPVLADSSLTGGVSGDGTTALSSLVFSKQIKVFNPDTTYAVRLPNVTYTYTITPITVDTSTPPTVSDADPDTAAVLSGVTVTDIFSSATASAAFTESTTVTDTTGASSGTLSNKVDVTFTVNNQLGSSVTRAGIYRYKITETLADSKTKAGLGIVEPTGYKESKYLDVYVGNVTENNVTSLKVVGFVMFDVDDDTAAETAPDGSLDTDNDDTKKTAGWGNGTTDPSTGDDTTNPDIDEYYTTNLNITKTTTGNMADKTHKFPISATLTRAAGLDQTVKVDCSVEDSSKGTPTVNGVQSFGATPLDVQASLCDGGSYWVKGIPSAANANMTVTALAENNNTLDKYTASAALTNLTGSTTLASIDGGGSSSTTFTSLTPSGVGVDNKTASARIAITNAMTDVSPTGLAFRVAPYVLMLAAGISLVLLFAKRRREITDMI